MSFLRNSADCESATEITCIDPGIKGGLNRSGGIHIEREIFLGEYPGIEFAGNQP